MTDQYQQESKYSEYLEEQQVSEMKVYEDNKGKGIWDAHIHSISLVEAIDRQLVEDDDYWEGFTMELRKIAIADLEIERVKRVSEVESIIF
jgi:hypothetical protein